MDDKKLAAVSHRSLAVRFKMDTLRRGCVAVREHIPSRVVAVVNMNINMNIVVIIIIIAIIVGGYWLPQKQ